MKKIIALLIALMLLAPAALADSVYAVVSTPNAGGRVYLRAEGTVNSRALALVNSGTGLEIIGEAAAWYKVKVLPSGKSGWMSKKYVSIAQGGSSESVQYASGARSVKSSDGFANLRYGPSTNFAVISELYNGTVVGALSREGKWLRVVTSTGAIGYVSEGLLRESSASVGAPLASYGEIYSSDGFANLRTGAGMDNSVITALRNGVRVRIMRQSGNWYQVEAGGQTGYVYSNLVRAGGIGQSTAGVNLRAGAGTSYSVLCVVPKGERVTVLATGREFSRVSYAGRTGYVSNRYLNV